MLHYMFAVKSDSKLFESFKAEFNKNRFTRDDLEIKLMIDPLPSFDVEGKPKRGLGYDVVCMIITPQIFNTSMLRQALDHSELFNKYFEEMSIETVKNEEGYNPFILTMGGEVMVSPVHYIPTFGDEMSILKNIGSPIGKHKQFIELLLTTKHKAVRSCLMNPTHLQCTKAIIDSLKVATLEHKANGVTPSISDLIISGAYYSFLENISEEARVFFIELICHTYAALNYTVDGARRAEYANFVISTIEDFKFPDHTGKVGLVE